MRNLIEALLANRDNRDEPIMSTPPPKPLRKSDSASMFSYVYNSFSVSNTIQQKITTAMDLPKWNETTLLVQIAETLSGKSGFQVLRSSDVCKRVWEWRMENAQVIADSDFNLIATNMEKETIYRMNASLFFTLLFVDPGFNSYLTIDNKITLGNALTFAVWKERMECDILMHQSDLTDYQEFSYTYDSDTFFQNFCSGAYNLLEMLETTEGISQILSTSPWCGLRSVLRIWGDQIKTTKGKVFVSKWNKKNQVIGQFFDDQSTDIYTKVQNFESSNKREMEDQIFLIRILTRINKIQPQDLKLKRLIQEIEQIVHTNVAIDAQTELVALYTERGIHLIETITQNPVFQKEMDTLSNGMKEYVSTTTANILSKTGKKLIEKTFNYFVVIPMAIKMLHVLWKDGLFASAKYAMETSVKRLAMGLSHSMAFAL